MSPHAHSLTLTSDTATARLAEAIGPGLQPGDTILLEGEIGAGKSHFARHLIWSVQDRPEDVPSPTFTLVQTYDTRIGAVWHADLYRLTSPDEIEELGLLDAIDTGICLIEWPDRLGPDRPTDALTLRLSHTADGAESRRADLFWDQDRWQDRLAAVLT